MKTIVVAGLSGFLACACVVGAYAGFQFAVASARSEAFAAGQKSVAEAARKAMTAGQAISFEDGMSCVATCKAPPSAASPAKP